MEYAKLKTMVDRAKETKDTAELRRPEVVKEVLRYWDLLKDYTGIFSLWGVMLDEDWAYTREEIQGLTEGCE